MRILNSSSQRESQGAGSIQRSGSGASSAGSARARAGLDSASFDQLLEQRVQDAPDARPSQASKEPARGGLERRNDDTSRPIRHESPVERHAVRQDVRPRDASRPDREDHERPDHPDRGHPQSEEPASDADGDAETEEAQAGEARPDLLGLLPGLGGRVMPSLHAFLGAHSEPAGAGSSGGRGPGFGASTPFSLLGSASGEHLGGLTAGPRASTEALRAHPFRALMAGAELTQALAATGLAGADADGNLGILDQNAPNSPSSGTDPASQSTSAPSADAAAQASREQKPLPADRAATLSEAGEQPESLDGVPIVLEIQAGQGDGGGDGQGSAGRGLEQGLAGDGLDSARLTQQLQQDSAASFRQALEAQSVKETTAMESTEAPGWITRMRGAIEQGLAAREDALSARVELDDPELGRIRLELHLEGGKVRVELVAEREQTRQLLKDGRQALEQELARHQQQLAQYSVGGDGTRDSRGFGKFQDSSRRAREAVGESRSVSGTEVALSKGRRLHEGQLDIIA